MLFIALGLSISRRCQQIVQAMAVKRQSPTVRQEAEVKAMKSQLPAVRWQEAEAKAVKGRSESKTEEWRQKDAQSKNGRTQYCFVTGYL